MTGFENMRDDARDENPETAPYCRITRDVYGGEETIELVLPDGKGGCVVGELSANDARAVTLGLRSVASEIDGKPFFDGGWNTAEAIRYAATELEELSEQYHMNSRDIENSNFEASRSKGRCDGTGGEQ